MIKLCLNCIWNNLNLGIVHAGISEIGIKWRERRYKVRQDFLLIVTAVRRCRRIFHQLLQLLQSET